MRDCEKWFAWFPVNTTQGFRWLVYVYRRWDEDLNPCGYDGYSGADGGYKYLAKEQP